MDNKIRYVDGGPCDSSGRCRWVHAYVGFRLAATFKGYTRKVEDNAMVLYPFRIAHPDLVGGDKRVISIRDIHSR